MMVTTVRPLQSLKKTFFTKFVYLYFTILFFFFFSLVTVCSVDKTIIAQ